MTDNQFLLIMRVTFIPSQRSFAWNNFVTAQGLLLDRSGERLAISMKRLNTGYKPITWIGNSFAKCQLDGGVDVE